MRRLFISYMKGFSKDICKNTLASSIRSLIKLAYDKCPHHLIQLSTVKLHEVRVMSASLAWRANIGLKDILSAACWSNHTTFTSFFLKDISIIKDELHSLGPLVAAQKVVVGLGIFGTARRCTRCTGWTFMVQKSRLSENQELKVKFK